MCVCEPATPGAIAQSLCAQNTVSSTDYLQRLETITQAVIISLLSALPTSQPGETLTLPVSVSSSSSVTVQVTLPPLGRAPPQAAKLQRLKRQYTTMNKQARGTMDDKALAALFAHYLDQNFAAT